MSDELYRRVYAERFRQSPEMLSEERDDTDLWAPAPEEE